MLRTIIWFIKFWVYQICFIPKLFEANKLKKLGESERFANLVYEVTSKWAKTMVENTGSIIEVSGLENIPKDETILFVSNHQGNFDIPILLGFLPVPKGFIAKQELGKLPMVSIWMKHMGCIFLDRKNIRTQVRQIGEAINELKSGTSLVIFPEGTRSKGNTMGEFKKGSFKLAIKSLVTIVPVTINGSYKIMEDNKNKIKPSSVKITICPPIKTAELSKEDLDNIHILTHDAISENLK